MSVHHRISPFGQCKYFEVLWTQCYWIFVCVFLYFAGPFASCWAYAQALKSSVLSFYHLIHCFTFAARWVHTRYSACKAHRYESCVLNTAAICCRKRTYPFPDSSVRASYVLFMLQTLYGMYLFPFCLLWLHTLTTSLRVGASAQLLFFLLLLFSGGTQRVDIMLPRVQMLLNTKRYIIHVLSRLVLTSRSRLWCFCDILAKNSLLTYCYYCVWKFM